MEEDSFSSDLVGRGKPSTATSFVRKLYNLVSCEAEDIVSFTPDGLAFEVKDPKKLEAEVLPKYFRHSRFQSFVRQLNFYNFKKTNKERSMWIYKHELFRRDRPDLLDKLKRKTSCGDVRRVARSVSSDSATTFSSLHQHTGWAALVKSSSESFLQLGEDSDDETVSSTATPPDPMMPPLPPRVPLNLAALQRRPLPPAAVPRPPHMVLETSAAGAPAGYAYPSPLTVTTSFSPSYSMSPRRSPLGKERCVPPMPLPIQRKRSADMMQTVYTDDEDDGGETDVSSGSSWESSNRSIRTRLVPPPIKEEPPCLGGFAELTIDEAFLDQFSRVLSDIAPSASSAVVPVMVLFSLQWTVRAVEDPEQVRAEIIKFILDNQEVSDELRAYRAALDPSLQLGRSCTSPRSPTADPISQRLLQTQGCLDRTSIVRDFIAFSLMQLQTVADRCSEMVDIPQEYSPLLGDTQRLWRRTAALLS